MKSASRRCAQCRKKVPTESAFIGGLRAFCSVEHLLEFTRSVSGQKAVKKSIRAETRKAKESIKRRSDWTKEAQVAVNAWVRHRDLGKPCISCGSMPAQKLGGTMDAGHYRSTGSAPHLRFLTTQIHAQCVKCNRHLSGNVADYRIGLIERIGQDKVDAIESDQTIRRYDVEYLKRLKSVFTRRLRQSKKYSN